MNTPHQSVSQMREAFARRRWRLRFSLQDLVLELRATRKRGFEPMEALAVLRGLHDGIPVEIVAPVQLIDVVLSRAPDPVTLDQLSPDDAGLLFEHVMTAQIEALEAQSGSVLSIARIERLIEQRSVGDLWIEIDAGGRVYPVNIGMASGQFANHLADYISALDKVGPPGLAGMPVTIGPVYLARREVDELAAGDELLLDGATLDKLTGAILLDDTLNWPISLIDGGIVVDGALREIELPSVRGEETILPVFFMVGVTGAAAAMQTGERIALQRVEEKRMVLRIGEQVLGRAGLVNLPEGLAIRFFGKETP